MIWPFLLVLGSILLASVGAVGLLALDLARRPVEVPARWLAVAGFSGTLPLVGLVLRLDPGSSPAVRWEQAESAASWAALALLCCAFTAAAVASALALSRAIDPGGPTHWRPAGVGSALVALLVLPLLVAVDWHGGRALVLLPLGWLAVPVLVFGRKGAPRLDLGAEAVLGLAWVAVAAYIGGLRVAQLDAYVRGLLSDGGRWEAFSTIPIEIPALWALGWATAAVRRPLAPSVLLVVAPAALATLAFTLLYLDAPSAPVSPPGPIPRTVDLAGRAPRQIGPPAFCLAGPSGAVGDCGQGRPAAMALAPDRPLSKVAPGWWMVLAPPETGVRPSLLRHRLLEVAPFEARLDHRLHFVEVDGRAQVELDGTVIVPPLPVERDLQRALEIALPRYGTYVAEVDPSPRWTVQDLVRLCMTTRALVESSSCALGPPTR